MRLRQRLVFFWMMLVATASLAGTGVPWQSWSDAAFDQARKTNKLVLVDLSAEWCAYCRKMDETTWRNPAVLAAIEQDYVAIQIVDKKDPELAERYRQYGRPAVIIMDADGKELMRKRGYMKPQWMEWMLQAVVQEHASGKP